MKRYLNFSIAFCVFSTWAVAQNPDSVRIAQRQLMIRADSLIANYKFEKALNVLMKADSLSIDILLKIGHCNSRLGASSSAIRPFEKVLELDSSNVTALNQLGQLHVHDGDFEKAFSVYLKLVQLDSTNSYYYKQVGNVLVRLEEKMQAKIWFEKARDLNPADAETSLALGNILLDMNDYEGVDDIVQQALAIDPKSKPILLLKARSAFEQHQFESVVIVINDLVAKSDTTILYARMLSVSYFNLHEYNKLINCINYLMSNRYDSEWIYYYMGVATRELGDVPASVAWFKMAIEKSISENMKTYYTQLGQSYEAIANYQEAIKAYKAAYNQSKEGILLYHLARNYDIYYKDKATALLYYEKYLQSEDTIRLTREYARKRMQDLGKF